MPDATTRIGPYELVRELGRGGMAVIFLARQPALEREVALKRLELRSHGPDLAERFLREAKLAGSFGHPNIVTVHDFFEHDGQPHIAMEFLKRGSLRPFLERGLSPAQVYGALEGMLEGLAHAASQGVVHRDMKPENVLVTGRGGVKIADFGIAKAYTKVTVAAPLTETGMALGTPHYMAPEQALAKPLGPYTDLYAVGAMAYEMVGGRTPFDAPGAPMAILLHHINEPPPPLPSDVDPRLAEWIMWLLAKEPEDRPADADEAWERLEEIAVDRLGSYWRRGAALLDPDEVGPLRRTPTPIPSQRLGKAALEPEAAAPHEPVVESTSNGGSGYLSFSLPVPKVAPAPPPEPVARTPTGAPEPPSTEPQPRSDDRVGFEPLPPGRPPVELPADRQPLAPAEPPEVAEPARTTPRIAALTVAQSRPSVKRVTRPLRRARKALGAGVLLAAASGVALIAALLAYAAAPAVTRAPAPLTITVQGDDLAVRVPSGWRWGRPTAVEGVPGLALRDAIALRPPRGPRGDAVLIGWSDTADASLVSAATIRAFGDPAPERVRLGALAAYGYGPLTASHARFTVYAVPTYDGVATVACSSQASGDVSRSCDGIAGSLRLGRSEPSGIPPRARFAQDVSAAVDRMSRDEKAAGRTLSNARRARTQAGALRRLAAVYGTAARSLERVSTAPFEAAATHSLGDYLQRLQRETRALAEAASGGHAKRYLQRRTAVRRLRSGLPQRIAALAAAGRGNGG